MTLSPGDQPNSEGQAAPPADTAAPNSLHFEAELVPHRSLSTRGLAILLGCMGVISLGVTTLFWFLGAWPIAGFNGAEVLLAVVLLRAHARSARASEFLVLTDFELCIQRTDSRGTRTEQRLPSAWIGVILEERQGRTPGLYLAAHGKRLEIGSALGEPEKRDLARALAEALHRWRHPTFDNPHLLEE